MLSAAAKIPVLEKLAMGPTAIDAVTGSRAGYANQKDADLLAGRSHRYRLHKMDVQTKAAAEAAGQDPKKRREANLLAHGGRIGRFNAASVIPAITSLAQAQARANFTGKPQRYKETYALPQKVKDSMTAPRPATAVAALKKPPSPKPVSSLPTLKKPPSVVASKGTTYIGGHSKS